MPKDLHSARACSPPINPALPRHHTSAKRSFVPRVPELMADGFNVAFGHDCLMDLWYGVCCDYMLGVAHMGLHVALMTSQKGIRHCFDAVTVNAAKVIHLQGYGVTPGCNASFVLLQARDVVKAIRLRANRLKVWRKRALLAKTSEVAARWKLKIRPDGTSFTQSIVTTRKPTFPIRHDTSACCRSSRHVTTTCNVSGEQVYLKRTRKQTFCHVSWHVTAMAGAMLPATIFTLQRNCRLTVTHESVCGSTLKHVSRRISP